MLSIKIETLVAQTVKHFLLSGKNPEERKQEALYFHFDLGMSYYAKKSFDERRGLHLLYHVPHGMLVSVFSSVTHRTSRLLHEADELVWKHETTHDCCWRDVRVFSETYFQMAEGINRKLEESGATRVPPAEMNEHNSFSLFSKELFNFVPVEVSYDPSDEYHYRRLIKVIS